MTGLSLLENRASKRPGGPTFGTCVGVGGASVPVGGASGERARATVGGAMAIMGEGRGWEGLWLLWVRGGAHVGSDSQKECFYGHVHLLLFWESPWPEALISDL